MVIQSCNGLKWSENRKLGFGGFDMWLKKEEYRKTYGNLLIKSLDRGGGWDQVMDALLQLNNLLKGLYLPFFKKATRGGGGGGRQPKTSILSIQIRKSGKFPLRNRVLCYCRYVQSIWFWIVSGSPGDKSLG